MSKSLLEKQFEKMGAELVIQNTGVRRFRNTRFAIDVQNAGKKDEVFLLSGEDLTREDIKVLDVQPDERHLLLMWNDKERKEKHKFLCGHDERHWFVAAVPGESVKNVTEAMEALKPDPVKKRERATGVSPKGKKERHNQARKRQGEWFFVPIWNRLKIDPMMILKKEPIQRGRAKPHICEFLYRVGGQAVWVSTEFPNGLTDKSYKRLLKKNPQAKTFRWRRMVRDAKVYARGRVSHPDHATLDLGKQWHEVLMNRENEAPSMRHMRFLD